MRFIWASLNDVLRPLAQPVEPRDLPPRALPERYIQGGLQDLRIQVVLHEYDAVKNEIQTALSNQVSILSFGAATVGLLVAGGAEIWSHEAAVTSVLYMIAIPLICLLTLAVYAGEQVRLMRAGLFVRQFEAHLSAVLSHPDGNLLTWEQWDIRSGARDVDAQARTAIQLVFVSLALIFVGAGFWRLEREGSAAWSLLLLALSSGIGLTSLAWIAGRFASAMKYRERYKCFPSATDPPPGPVPDEKKPLLTRAWNRLGRCPAPVLLLVLVLAAGGASAAIPACHDCY